jgi:integrase
LFEQLCNEPVRSLCLLALKTGMRQGELLALRWRDVDLDQAVIRVRSSYTGGVLGTPKNRERRDVDLITDVVELVASLGNAAATLGLKSCISAGKPNSKKCRFEPLDKATRPALTARCGVETASCLIVSHSGLGPWCVYGALSKR